jgi:hypothetical protein
MPVTGCFAQISVAHELISVFVKSHQRTTDPTSCVARAATFCLGVFIFFGIIYQIRENDQKLERMLILQVTFCCGMTP